MKKAFKFSAIVASLVLAGCAQMPTSEQVAPAAEPFEAPVPSGISFSVHGGPQGDAECLARYSMGYTRSTQPVDLSLSLETEMKQVATARSSWYLMTAAYASLQRTYPLVP